MSFDMDEMCNTSEAEDLNKTITNSEEAEILKRSQSPVFKCFNTRTNRAEDSSDYDIPSYQINQSQKSRTSSKCENDFVLPFSPVCSPIPVNTLQFQPPSIHSLGTIVKNMENVRTKVKETTQGNVFQSLGMNDKDISWVSSMASPPPKQLPGSEFNTLEKATFFPEDKFQNIQPRALFSPTSDTDCGCQLISSDSEDDDAYRTNIRLSDVCATLKQLEFQSFDSDAKNSSVEFVYSPVIKVKKLESSKKKRKGVLVKSPPNSYSFSVSDNSLSKTKEGSTLIEDDSFQSMSFSCLDELCNTVTEQGESKPKKQFCGVKQFYPTKTKDVYEVSSMDGLHSYARALEEGDVELVNGKNLDKSMADKNIIRFDKLNHSKVDGTKRSHSEVSDVKDELTEKKVKVVDGDWENLKEYLSESQLNVSDSEICKTVENLEKTLASQESKELKLSGDVSQERNTQEERQNPSDTYQQNNSSIYGALQEGFATAAGAIIPISEKSLNKARQMLKDCEEGIVKQEGFSTVSGKLIQVSDKALERAKALMVECEEETTKHKATGKEKFKTLKVSPEALEKAKALMEDCDRSVKEENLTLKTTGSFQGFQTGSGKIIKVSPKALEKAKALMSECEDKQNDELISKQNQVSEKGLKKEGKTDDKNTKAESFIFWKPIKKPNKVSLEDTDIIIPDNLAKFSFQGFSTGSGRQIKVSDESLKKAKALMDDCDKEGNSTTLEVTKLGAANKPSFQGFQSGSGKIIKVSDEALKKAKALMKECDEVIKPGTTEEVHGAHSEDTGKNIPEKLNKLSFQGFLSGSGKIIKVSDEALKKAKTLMDDCDESMKVEKNTAEGLSKISFKGFLSGSGKEIKISDEALKKAKAFLEDCNNDSPVGNVKQETKQDGVGFSSGKSIHVRGEALKKGKQMMKGESTEELSSIWMGESANESFSENKPLERGEESESVIESKVEDDWDEIIPSWLHVYNTSPSIASDRLEMSPLLSHENGNTSKGEREYMKSPVLGVGDRFYRKVKKRKLNFTEPTKRTKSTSKLDFSAPFKKAKLMETVRVDVKEERQRARELQEKSIKEKEKVKPFKGQLSQRKSTEKRIKWVEAVGNSSPEVHSEESLRSLGVREDVLKVCIDNAADFTFTGEDFFGSGCQNNVQESVGDGCLVILNDENRFGVGEVKRAFLASPGVQPNLVPSGWVENHYKWIVWKLAHYEKSFPRYFAGRSLTPNNVTLQLKYRYDREIDRNERSALKKILEKDDTSIKRMVLCVCAIKKVLIGEMSGYELTLTDGWYSCPVRVDTAMSRLIEEGKVVVGTKLQTQGATLSNCEQGISPLEMGGNVYLKISTNSTRRVRWDTKLGFQKNPENFPISLGSILPQGGLISRVDVIVVRVYPVLYMEKTSDGYHVTRNRRTEEKAEAEFRKYQEERMEKILAEVQSEMKHVLEKSKSESRYCDGEQEDEFDQFAGCCSDPIALKKVLSQEKRFTKEFSERIEKKLKSEKFDKRNVSEFLRVKIVDFRKKDYNKAAVLCVWNPNEDLLGILSEGKVLSLMNITVSNSYRSYKSIQMNTTRQTQYRAINKPVKYPARKLTFLKDVSSKVCPAFEEVDVVGMVAVVRDVSHGSRLSQVVYLTDLEFHFVGVVFWGNCRDYGWENVLKIRSVVACSNLQWEKTINKEVPSLHVSENSIFTENPRQEYLKEEMSRLKGNIPKDVDVFLSKCEEELTAQLEESKWGANKSLDNSKWRLSNEFESKPAASSTPIKPLPARLSSLGCAEPSPIQKRIEKLQNYGEPPPLIPLLVRSRKIKKS